VVLLSPFLPGEARGNGTTALRTKTRLEAAGALVWLVRSDPEVARLAIEERRPDVVHAIHATWAAHALLDVEGLPPLVLTVGGNDVHEDLSLPSSPAIDLVRRARVTISATPEELACAQRLGTDPGAHHLLVARWPLVGHEPLGDRAERPPHPVVAWCGAMRHQKRPALLVEVHRELRRLVPNAETVVAGPDPRDASEARWFDTIRREPGMRRCTTYANGHGGSAGAFLARADVVLNTSLHEGQSNFLLEAIHERVPLVAARAPGNRAWIEHGTQGLLYEEPDEAAALLAGLLRDAGERDALAARARGWLEASSSPQGERDGLARAHRLALSGAA
jgi:glycosyltransferase involved in cell wall biosynthesis